MSWNGYLPVRRCHSRGAEMTGQLRLYEKYEQLRYCTLDDRSIALKGKHVVDKCVNTAAISMFLRILLFSRVSIQLIIL